MMYSPIEFGLEATKRKLQNELEACERAESNFERQILLEIGSPPTPTKPQEPAKTTKPFNILKKPAASSSNLLVQWSPSTINKG